MFGDAQQQVNEVPALTNTHTSKLTQWKEKKILQFKKQDTSDLFHRSLGYHLNPMSSLR